MDFILKFKDGTIKSFKNVYEVEFIKNALHIYYQDIDKNDYKYILPIKIISEFIKDAWNA